MRPWDSARRANTSGYIVPDLLGLALEEAAHAWAKERPDQEMTVSELVAPALKHYDKYFRLYVDLKPNRDQLIMSFMRSLAPVCSWGFLGYYPAKRK